MCGSISILSINGNWWLCIVMNNVSRLLFLFFMKNKDDTATYIKEYVEMVNIQQLGGVKVQQMHYDGGGEFINNKFLKGKGVKQTVSTPHTSEHNVVFRENIFKVSNEHITIATPSYVRSDTVFVDNSTSTRPDDIEDDLTNWTSPDE
jgi:hypothetical protein